MEKAGAWIGVGMATAAAIYITGNLWCALLFFIVVTAY